MGDVIKIRLFEQYP